MPGSSNPDANHNTSNPRPSNGKTILLAEDDPFISRMYDIKLSNAGFTVLVTRDGQAAYQQIKARRPDLAVLDINMPELSGFEVIKKLIAAGPPSFDTDKVIILTNSANLEDRDLAERLGVEYIIKADLTPHEVLNRINARLGLPSV